jgi:serine/threonine protein kinase
MNIEEKFHREIQYRQENEELVKKQAVIAIDEHHNTTEDSIFKSAMESFPLDRSRTEKLIEYKYAIVMPHANRNLDTICRSERPDLMKIHSDAHDIAEKLKILHDNDIIHGDLKMQNIIRKGEKLVLIDLDASATKSTSEESKHASCHVGKKFSSGILPPEMIYHLKEKDEVDKFTDYFLAFGQEKRRLEKDRTKTVIVNS